MRYWRRPNDRASLQLMATGERKEVLERRKDRVSCFLERTCHLRVVADRPGPVAADIDGFQHLMPHGHRAAPAMVNYRRQPRHRHNGGVRRREDGRTYPVVGRDDPAVTGDRVAPRIDERGNEPGKPLGRRQRVGVDERHDLIAGLDCVEGSEQFQTF